MSGKRIPLETLRVASPCHASWETMTGDDRARLCPECNLHVYNLSAMSREEAEALVWEKEGRVCVRYYRRADGTVLTRDCPVGLRAIGRRLGLVAGAVAGALVALLGWAAFGSVGTYSTGSSGSTTGSLQTILDWFQPQPIMGKIHAPPAPSGGAAGAGTGQVDQEKAQEGDRTEQR